MNTNNLTVPELNRADSKGDNGAVGGAQEGSEGEKGEEGAQKSVQMKNVDIVLQVITSLLIARLLIKIS